MLVGSYGRFFSPHALDGRRFEDLVSVSSVNTKTSVWGEEEQREGGRREGEEGGRDGG